MPEYTVHFYNTSSGWKHSEKLVEAADPDTAERLARESFDSDFKLIPGYTSASYRAAVTELDPTYPVIVEDAPQANGFAFNTPEGEGVA